MSERREPPSARRVREARRRGEVAISRELCAAAGLFSGLAALALSTPTLAGALLQAVRQGAGAAALLGAPSAGPPDFDPAAVLQRALALLGRTAGPPCAAAALGTLIAGVVQTRGLFALGAASPRWERLRPGAGLRRLVARERLVGLALSTARAAVLVALGWLGVTGALRTGPALSRSGAGLASALAGSVLRLAWLLGAVVLTSGCAELLLARAGLRRRLSTTRPEALRERREEEGDPRLAAERRRHHRALAAAGSLARATCLVVNPTHVAVALRHRPGEDDAPVVVAKGVGRAAARLRASARRAGVPVVHDVALARALLRLAEVGDAIPEELYEAAAAVLVRLGSRAGEVGAP